MSCQCRYQGCKKYQKKRDYDMAIRTYPGLDNPLKDWECTEAEEKTCKQFKATPPRMTQYEFETTQETLLKDVPDEFRGTISYRAWERGHSAGYEEVIAYVREMITDLQSPIKKFEDRIRQEHHAKVKNIA